MTLPSFGGFMCKKDDIVSIVSEIQIEEKEWVDKKVDCALREMAKRRTPLWKRALYFMGKLVRKKE